MDLTVSVAGSFVCALCTYPMQFKASQNRGLLPLLPMAASACDLHAEQAARDRSLGPTKARDKMQDPQIAEPDVRTLG